MTLWQLMQLKSAIKLERAGMKHSSGRSARKVAALWLGLPPRSKHERVIEELQRYIDEAKTQPQGGTVELLDTQLEPKRLLD